MPSLCQLTNDISIHQFEVVIIGAGGAGLRAALELSAAGKQVAVISKVFPTRSHTTAAQGGISAAIGNVHEDNWLWHMFDTVKGSDYLGDQDCIEFMCKNAPEVVYELEHMGLPFSRLDNGKIYQRPFGGQSKAFGKGGQASRTLAAADRTGHALLHTLYQQNLRVNTIFFNECFALDLVKNSYGQLIGTFGLDLALGKLRFFHAKAVILATGGAGQIYQATSNALINTGDGIGMALRYGLGVQDLEMWQFHPTGLYDKGILISEASRGEGGYLLNKHGERFMERYAPIAKDLASRDLVTRAIAKEILEGRGCGEAPGHYVELKLEHLGSDLIKQRLPWILELANTFAGVDPTKQAIPVFPTCHYMMGGIPTDRTANVLMVEQSEHGEEAKFKEVEHLYAIGECACISIHGANRLGGNSLLELIVFGRESGRALVNKLSQGLSFNKFKPEDLATVITRFNNIVDPKNLNVASIYNIKAQLKQIMQNNFGVFRNGSAMAKGLQQLEELHQSSRNIRLKDRSIVFNTELVELLELDNLFLTAIATARTAFIRTESRGAHIREDFPERDDANWLKHIIVLNNQQVFFRKVNLIADSGTSFTPTSRSY